MRLDPESEAWLSALKSEAGPRDKAIEELRAFIHRGLRKSMHVWARQRGPVGPLARRPEETQSRGTQKAGLSQNAESTPTSGAPTGSHPMLGELDALIDDLAQDSVLRILDRIDTYRGESRFTTWAMKVAVRVALTELRRRRWRDVSLDTLMEGGFEPISKVSSSTDPVLAAEQKEALEMIGKLLKKALTKKQRLGMTAIMIKGMPIEEVARRMGTNRNALYKLLHDARNRLRKEMENQGMETNELLAIFEK